MSRLDRQRRRTVSGAALLIALTALAVALFFLEDLIERFQPRYTIYAVLEQAPRVSAGSAVWISGKAVGTVGSIGFLPRSRDSTALVAVALVLPRDVQDQIRADSRVHLTAARLIGMPVIDIVPGTPARPPLAAGDTLYADRQLDVAALTAQAALVRAQFDSATAGLERALPGSSRQRERLRAVQANLAGAHGELAALQHAYRTGPAHELLGDAAFTDALTRASSQLAEIRALAAGATDRWTDSTGTARALDQLQREGAVLRARLDTLTAVLGQGEGVLSRMAQDSALTRALHGARAQLDSLMADVRRNPLRYVF